MTLSRMRFVVAYVHTSRMSEEDRHQDNTACQTIYVSSTCKLVLGLQAPKALGSSTTLSSDQSKYENSFASAVTMSLQLTPPS